MNGDDGRSAQASRLRGDRPDAAPLAGIGACVFDAYGTLFDVASPARRCTDALGEDATRLAALWRERQLAYSWLRTVQGRHVDFWQVTGDALDFALEALRIDDQALRARLLELYRTPDVYAEVPPMLAALRRAGIFTAILSNGAPAMLDSAVRAAGLGAMLDAVWSVEAAGAFKPHPDVYRLAVEGSGKAARAIAFVSSNGWDAHAASAYGMRAIWCNRHAQPDERLPGAPDRVLETLETLPAIVVAAREAAR
jgi:2-haloacid dehalogenase